MKTIKTITVIWAIVVVLLLVGTWAGVAKSAPNNGSGGGGGSGGVGTSDPTQVIYNDDGTKSGDPGMIYIAATDTLMVGSLVTDDTPGSNVLILNNNPNGITCSLDGSSNDIGLYADSDGGTAGSLMICDDAGVEKEVAFTDHLHRDDWVLLDEEVNITGADTIELNAVNWEDTYDEVIIEFLGVWPSVNGRTMRLSPLDGSTPLTTQMFFEGTTLHSPIATVHMRVESRNTRWRADFVHAMANSEALALHGSARFSIADTGKLMGIATWVYSDSVNSEPVYQTLFFNSTFPTTLQSNDGFSIDSNGGNVADLINGTVRLWGVTNNRAGITPTVESWVLLDEEVNFTGEVGVELNSLNWDDTYDIVRIEFIGVHPTTAGKGMEIRVLDGTSAIDTNMSFTGTTVYKGITGLGPVAGIKPVTETAVWSTDTVEVMSNDEDIALHGSARFSVSSGGHLGGIATWIYSENAEDEFIVAQHLGLRQDFAPTTGHSGFKISSIDADGTNTINGTVRLWGMPTDPDWVLLDEEVNFTGEEDIELNSLNWDDTYGAVRIEFIGVFPTTAGKGMEIEVLDGASAITTGMSFTGLTIHSPISGDWVIRDTTAVWSTDTAEGMANSAALSLHGSARLSVASDGKLAGMATWVYSDNVDSAPVFQTLGLLQDFAPTNHAGFKISSEDSSVTNTINGTVRLWGMPN